MITTLTKASYNDLKAQANAKRLGYFYDLDETYIYFEVYEYSGESGGMYEYYRYNYTWGNGILSVDTETKSEVVKNTGYTVKESSVEKRLSLLEKILSNFGGTNKETKREILKQFDQEKMQVLEPLYIAGGEVDGHGDAYKDPVKGPEQLVKALLEGKERGCLQYSIGHLCKTKTFEVSDAFVVKGEVELDNGVIIPENQPVAVIKFKNKAAFQDRINGQLSGLSIGALGKAELIKELDELLMDTKEPKRLLSEFIFTHKAAHLAYTLPIQGGAASLKNEMYSIVKSKLTLKDVIKEYLERYDEEFTELDKAKFKTLIEFGEETAPSTSALSEAQDAGVDKQTVNKGQDEMSETEKLELAELRKERKALKIEKNLNKYPLLEETKESLALALADLENHSAVTKAIDELVASYTTQITTLETEKETLTKSKAVGDNGLLAELEKEKGQNSAEPQKTSMSLGESVTKAVNARLSK